MTGKLMRIAGLIRQLVKLSACCLVERGSAGSTCGRRVGTATGVARMRMGRLQLGSGLATLYATRGRAVERAGEGSRDQRRLNEDDRYTVMRFAHFRAAAEYVAAAFAGIPSVSRVALFGSVAAGPRMESTRARARGGHIHEPKDVDIAVWLDDATELERLRLLRSRAVNGLWEEREVGVAHHQVDVFLLDAAGTYLGRLCCFNRCPKERPECRAVNCGKVPFLRQHDEFILNPDSLRPDRIQVLYDRSDQPNRSPLTPPQLPPLIK
jgi:predicted nucleotidyltransferase